MLVLVIEGSRGPTKDGASVVYASGGVVKPSRLQATDPAQREQLGGFRLLRVAHGCAWDSLG